MPLSEALGYLLAGYLGLVLFFGGTGVIFWTVLSLFYKPFPAVSGFAPSLSIVVPVYNEAPCLRAFLDHLFTAIARYAGKVEPIILDDGSDDGTIAILEEYRGRHDFRLVADGVHLGKLAQLERAFAMVSGEVLVTIDADAFLAPEALGELVSPLSSADYQAVFGNLLPLISPDSAVGLKLFLRIFFAFINHGLRRGQSVLGCLSIIGSNLSALRMSFFKPLWPEIRAGALWRAGRDDNALALHFLRAGAKTVFQQTAVAYSQAPSQARIVLSQHCRFQKDRGVKYRMLASLFWRRPLFVLGMAFLEGAAFLALRPILFAAKHLWSVGRGWREVKEYRWQAS